tara:strand:- start:971 stop:1594 length:624 start_codon:yes stop_codon:yes gene_type:complete
MTAKLPMVEMVANIISIWKLSTPQEKRDGIVWYVDAHKECQQISQEFGIADYEAAGVISALSPNNRWELNLRNARDMITAFMNGDNIDSFSVCTYPKMKEKAWGILQERPDYDGMKVKLSGKKITCFYENIMGEDTCTIDGHARNIAYNERVTLTSDANSITVREYAELQEAYRQAAKKLRYQNKRLKAYELQAVTWVAWRRMHGIK